MRSIGGRLGECILWRHRRSTYSSNGTMMAAKKKNTEGFAFLVDALQKNRDAVYADVKAAAEKKGLVVHPIMFGRAKLKLGLVKAGKGMAKKAAAERATGMRRGPGRPRKVDAGAPRRGPGRPRKNAAPGLDGLGDIIAAVRASQQDLGRYREALLKIQTVLAGVLD